jgi:hypothetical protein
VSLVKSRVVPDGTVMPERTIVAQEALDLLTAAAPEEPENVQEALLARSGAAVGAGIAAGAAETIEAAVANKPRTVEI